MEEKMNTKMILLLIILSNAVFARENFIELGTGYISAKDNFIYIKDKKSVDLVNSPTKQDIIVPIFTLQYNGFFIGAGDNSEGIGYRHDGDDVSIEVAINSYEVFENPYIVSKRVDATEIGVVISTTMDEMMEFSLGYKNIKVDDNVSKADTQQSANQLNFNMEAILLVLGQNSYAGLGYHFTYYDSKGESNSYLKNGISVFTIFELAKDYELFSQVSYVDYKFNKKNSFFLKIRDEKELILATNLRVNNIFNSRDFFLQTGIFYNGINSNINFFDKEYAGGSFSIGYKF